MDRAAACSCLTALLRVPPYTLALPVICLSATYSETITLYYGMALLDPYVLALVLTATFTCTLCFGAGAIFFYRRYLRVQVSALARQQQAATIKETVCQTSESPPNRLARHRSASALPLPTVSGPQPSPRPGSLLNRIRTLMNSLRALRRDKAELRDRLKPLVLPTIVKDGRRLVRSVRQVSAGRAHAIFQVLAHPRRSDSSPGPPSKRYNALSGSKSTDSFVFVDLESPIISVAFVDGDIYAANACTNDSRASTPSLSSAISSPMSISSCWEPKTPTAPGSLLASSVSFDASGCVPFPTVGSLEERPEMLEDTLSLEPEVNSITSELPSLLSHLSDTDMQRFQQRSRCCINGECGCSVFGKGKGLDYCRDVGVSHGIGLGISSAGFQESSHLFEDSSTRECQGAEDEHFTLASTFSSTSTVVGIVSGTSDKYVSKASAVLFADPWTTSRSSSYLALLDALTVSFSMSSLDLPASNRSSGVLCTYTNYHSSNPDAPFSSSQTEDDEASVAHIVDVPSVAIRQIGSQLESEPYAFAE